MIIQVCKRVLYSGQVQGVGFRHTAAGLARGFAVAGYVRNLPDGRVELVAEGSTVEVDGFLQAVAIRLADYIEHQEETSEPTGQHAGFSIRQ
jgi:acylphosphatase